MSAESLALAVPASVAIGAAISVAGLREKAVQLLGTFSATISIEVSLNGVDFEPIAATTDLTAPAVVPLPFLCQSIRANTTVFASGVPSAVVIGDNPRTS